MGIAASGNPGQGRAEAFTSSAKRMGYRATKAGVMTKQLRARSFEDTIKLCEASFERTQAFGEQLAHALWEYNARLIDYVEAIKKAQPKAHGAVLLQLDSCGKSCCACPHPRWVKWVNRNKQNRKAPPTWFGAQIAQPGNAARAKHIPDEARELIRQAHNIVRRRARLLAEFARFQHVLAGHIQHDPTLALPPETD